MRCFPLAAAVIIGSLAACASTPAPVAPPAAALPAYAPGPAPVTPPHAARAESSSALASPPAASPPSPPEAPPSPAFQAALEAADRALSAGDLAATDRHLAAAATAAGDDAHLGYLVARTRAARYAHAGDFEQAAAAFVAVIPKLAKHPELPDEFWSHNAMMMIREAQGDPAAALAEDDQATLCAARGTWDAGGAPRRSRSRRIAGTARTSRGCSPSRARARRSRRSSQYAKAALDDYRTRGFPESVAVLEAYFAALDGNRDAALAAAKRVDPAKDDDVEDLYLVVVGLEAGGDHAGAEAVRRVMRRPGRPQHLARHHAAVARPRRETRGVARLHAVARVRAVRPELLADDARQAGVAAGAQVGHLHGQRAQRAGVDGERVAAGLADAEGRDTGGDGGGEHPRDRRGSRAHDDA